LKRSSLSVSLLSLALLKIAPELVGGYIFFVLVILMLELVKYIGIYLMFNTKFLEFGG
jgi:hypothetical protein